MADVTVFSNQKILVVGLGREGVALTNFLLKHGVEVTATDIRTKAMLGAVIEPLVKGDARLVLGGEHPLSLLDETDLVFVSPGVSLQIPLLQTARTRNIPLSTETRLFCQLCPAQIMAITGSSGKSTTTTLLGKIMAADGRKTWVGGNIGQPLIELVDEMTADDVVVMELSSFQLDFFRPQLNRNIADERWQPLISGWSPSISTILNITPNHLDRHSTMKSYVRAKRAIIDHQPPDGTIIMSLDNDITRTIGQQYRDKVRWFSVTADMPNGACLHKDQLAFLHADGSRYFVAHKDEIKLRGRHNLANMMAACLMADTAGVSIEAMREVLTTFTGLPHRLELVGEHEQVQYFNDSIATSPDRVMAALRSFDEPLVLLAGGRDKKLSWDEVARVIAHKTEHVIVYGEAQTLIVEAIKRACREISTADTEIHLCSDLTEAFHTAAKVAQPGMIVLLSPGCASYDAFFDFEERGAIFRALVASLTA